MALVSLFSWM